MNALLGMAICFAVGLLFTRVMKLFNIPNVTGFIVAGLIIGPYAGKLITVEMLQGFEIISSVALGFVAFAAGSEFRLKLLKQIGGKIMLITVFQAFAAVFVVMFGLFMVHLARPDLIGVPAILILGAISAATAPAITLLVIKQYKARGHLTDTLLPVVAFDDLIGLFIFSICLGIAKVIATGAKPDASSIILFPLLEILKSLGVGLGLGLILVVMCKFFKSRTNRLIWVIICILAGVALSELWEMSSLITCMTIGMTFTNLRKDHERIIERVDMWTPPFYMAFFIFSGAHLDVRIIPAVGIVGIVYIVSRSFGKYAGTFVGAVAVKESKPVRNYLGLCLLPQAGVAIGMMTVVANTPGLESIVPQITTVVLSATILYELTGPIFTKWALKHAGEITEEGHIPLVNMIRNMKARRKARIKFISGGDVDIPSEVVIEEDRKQTIEEGLKDGKSVLIEDHKEAVLDHLDSDVDYDKLRSLAMQTDEEYYYGSSNEENAETPTVEITEESNSGGEDK